MLTVQRAQPGLPVQVLPALLVLLGQREQQEVLDQQEQALPDPPVQLVPQVFKQYFQLHIRPQQ